MAYTSPLYVEDDNVVTVKEVHISPECRMDRTRYNLHGKRVFIFVRSCVCDEYVNTYRLGIDFELDDLDVDGVFIHLHSDGFHRYEEIRRGRRGRIQKRYIFETQCNCANEYEQHSHH
jgi:hypothetical protein